VDLSLLDPQGREADMGTGPAAAGGADIAEEKIDRGAGNRRILPETMEEAGLLQLPIEWWHFDALPAAEVKSSYTLVE